MKREKFTYRDLDQLEKKAEQLGVHLPFAVDTSILRKSLPFGMVMVPNRMGIAPMEEADAPPGGSSSKLTTRRYVRGSVRGSGLIWFEAISIVPEGCPSTYQLVLTRDNLDHYKRFAEEIKEVGQKGNGFAPYLVMQVNHSDRYSNPQGRPAPLIAYRHLECEKLRPADNNCIISDDYLKSLEEKSSETIILAREAGSGAVDIKSCRGYLLAELTSAYNHIGRYGGSLENRTRLLCNGITAAKDYENDRFLVTARIGIFGGFAYPYGLGVKEGNGEVPDMEEPIRPVRSLYENYGLPMINLTMRNPYVNTHVIRSYDFGKYVPDEHPPSEAVQLINGIGAAKKVASNMVISASDPSYLRQYSSLLAVGVIKEELYGRVLLGRMFFINPEFSKQVMETGRMDPKKTYVACGKCGDLVRAGKPTGCVVRDTVLYLEHYREYLEETKER